MLALFRTNQILFSIFFLIYLLVLRVSYLVVPTEVVFPAGGLGSQWLFGLLPQGGWGSYLLAMGLVFFQAVYLSLLFFRYRILSELTLFPGLFFVLAAAILPDFLPLSPTLVASTFLVIATGELFEVYKKNKVADRVFNIGFWLSVGALFQPTFLLLLPWALFGLNSLRANKLNEVLTLLFGYLTPIILVGTYWFWQDRLDEFIAMQFVESFGFSLPQMLGNIQSYLGVGILLLLLLLVLFSYGFYMSRRNIQSQKRLNILFTLLIFSFLPIIFHTSWHLSHLYLLTIPIGIFVGISIESLENRWAESAHLLLLVLILSVQFYPYFVK